MTQHAVCWSLADLQARFLQVRDRIETHARIYFRHVKCWFRKADLVAETIALAWVASRVGTERQGRTVWIAAMSPGSDGAATATPPSA